MGNGFDIISAVNTKYPELKTQGWVDFNENGEKDENEELKDVNEDGKKDESEYYKFVGNNRSYIPVKIIDSAVEPLIAALKDKGFKIPE